MRGSDELAEAEVKAWLHCFCCFSILQPTHQSGNGSCHYGKAEQGFRRDLLVLRERMVDLVEVKHEADTFDPVTRPPWWSTFVNQKMELYSSVVETCLCTDRQKPLTQPIPLVWS